MFVVRGNRRIVIARDTSDAAISEERHGLVRPGSVTREIAEVIDRVYLPGIDVIQDSAERREIRMNVRDQRVTHYASASSCRAMTMAVSGQAPLNSEDCLTAPGTASRVVRSNPKR